MKTKKIYAVIYLLPLLGKPNHKCLNLVIEDAIEQLDLLEEAGVKGVLFENEHDQPYTLKAGPEIVASMTKVMSEIQRHRRRVELGVEFLINDPYASLAVAKVCDLDFIRTDYFIDQMFRKEYGGEIEINAKDLIEYRKKIGSKHIKILADIQVKYATMLTPRSLTESAEIAELNHANGVIITGTKTGVAPDTTEIKDAAKGLKHTNLFIGSGLNHMNLKELLPLVNGAIVGQGLMESNRIDQAKVKEFTKNFRSEFIFD